MKKNLLFSFLALFLLGATLTGFYACKKADIGTELPKVVSPISIQILDADLASAVQPKNIKVEIVGENALEVVDYTNKTDFKVSNGLITIGLKEDATPSDSKVYKFTLIAKAEGYLSAFLPITINATKDKPSIETMRMVNLSKTPQGVEAKEGSFASGAAASIKTGDVLVNVPANTVLKDANGNVLNGQVKTTLVSFDPTSIEAQRAFPGGFSPNAVKDANGKDLGGGTFMTAGFVSLDMEVNGTDVKTFSQPIEVEMKIKKDLRKPGTNTPVAIGDKWPIWSMDKNTGEWKAEGESVIEDDGAGGMKMVIKPTHLSWWNIDYFWGPSCWVGATINFTNFAPNDVIFFEIREAYSGQLLHWGYNAYLDGAGTGVGNIYNAPPIDVVVYVYNNSWGGGTPMIVSSPFNACSGNITISCTACPPPNPEVCADITLRCQNNAANVVIRPFSPIYMRPAGYGPWYYMGFMDNGMLCSRALSIQVGQRYDLWTPWVPGIWDNYLVQSLPIIENRNYCP